LRRIASQVFTVLGLTSLGVRTLYENELEAVQVAYPGTRIWRDEEGMWLLSESAVVADAHYDHEMGLSIRARIREKMEPPGEAGWFLLAG
jgi:hypothetical protein